MLGKDLIKWIQDNKAEDLPVSVQYRTSCEYFEGEELVLRPDLIEKGEGDYGFYIETDEFRRLFPGKDPKEFDEDWQDGEECLRYKGRRIVL